MNSKKNAAGAVASGQRFIEIRWIPIRSCAVCSEFLCEKSKQIIQYRCAFEKCNINHRQKIYKLSGISLQPSASLSLTESYAYSPNTFTISFMRSGISIFCGHFSRHSPHSVQNEALFPSSNSPPIILYQLRAASVRPNTLWRL